MQLDFIEKVIGAMEIEKKLNCVENKVRQQIHDTNHYRNRAKFWAFYLKIGSVAIAGLITILIGFRIETSYPDLIPNIVLILGASITVINALDAFFDHRLYWIYKTAIWNRYRQLLGDIMFYKTGLDITEYDEISVTHFMDRYNEIFEDDRKSWVQLRKQEISQDLVVK